MLHPISYACILGALIVAGGGILSGSGVWPIKLMRRYQFEHWWFIAMVTGLVVVPWSVTLLFCPDAMRGFGAVPFRSLFTANLWAAGWGVANVLCGISYLRLGVALTSAIITGLSVVIGVSLPMVVKGSGLFKDASDLKSPAGLTVMAGVSVMLIGVVLASLAGAGRERARQKEAAVSGGFLASLLLAMIAGLLSCGMLLAFVYGQGPIMHAMRVRGAGEIPATFAVWAVGLPGGALVSTSYPAWLMTKNRSWGLLGQNWREFLLAVMIGVNLSVSVVLVGVGMRMLGVLGASVGIGIQTATWMLGGQGLGFASGEWAGVSGSARKQILVAIICMVIAVLIMIRGNLLGAR
jgi:hypothetical protein